MSLPLKLDDSWLHLAGQSVRVIRWRLILLSPQLLEKFQAAHARSGAYLWSGSSQVQGPPTLNSLPFGVDARLPAGAGALVGDAYDGGAVGEVWALWLPEVIPRPAGEG